VSSKTFVPSAQKKPKRLKLASNELHSARPIVMGTMENFVQWPVFSPRMSRLMSTVNRGDDDLIVATNDTAMCFNATRPKTTVRQRNAPMKIIS
jgi:uncharacterized protein YqcC (DUF446 family)